VPVLGVVPYVHDLRIADEDSVALEDRRGRRRAGDGEIEIAVVRLPHIANYDDFQPLEHEAGVVVRFVEDAGEIQGADLVVLPGTKSTMADLQWLRERGLAAAILVRAGRGEPVLGICGGCQMLGGVIEDPESVESGERRAEGLGLLPIATRFVREKRTSQVRARAARESFLCAADGSDVFGYEIHMGRVERQTASSGAFAIVQRNGQRDDDVDGCVSEDRAVVGTMIHGLFENAGLRAALIASSRRRKGVASSQRGSDRVVDPYDRLATVIRDNVRMDLLRRLAGA
jgi:adenosylcobyric acid synthase